MIQKQQTYVFRIDTGISRIGLKWVISMLILSVPRAADELALSPPPIDICFSYVWLTLHPSVSAFSTPHPALPLDVAVSGRFCNSWLNRFRKDFHRPSSTNSLDELDTFFNRSQVPNLCKQYGQLNVVSLIVRLMQIKQKRWLHGNNTGSTTINKHFKHNKSDDLDFGRLINMNALCSGIILRSRFLQINMVTWETFDSIIWPSGSTPITGSENVQFC